MDIHLSLVGLQGLDCGYLIVTHKTTVTDNISTENSSELTFKFLGRDDFTPLD
jgi:hypothetical protein